MKFIKLISIIFLFASLCAIIIGVYLQSLKSRLPLNCDQTIKILEYKRIGDMLQNVGLIFLGHSIILLIVLKIMDKYT